MITINFIFLTLDELHSLITNKIKTKLSTKIPSYCFNQYIISKIMLKLRNSLISIRIIDYDGKWYIRDSSE